jgi:hypothetical protein
MKRQLTLTVCIVERIGKVMHLVKDCAMSYYTSSCLNRLGGCTRNMSVHSTSCLQLNSSLISISKAEVMTTERRYVNVNGLRWFRVRPGKVLL